MEMHEKLRGQCETVILFPKSTGMVLGYYVY